MICAFKPASDNAPDGSGMDLVSVGQHQFQSQIAEFTLKDILDSGTDLIVVDLDDTVSQLLTQPEGLLSDDPDCSAVRKRSDFIQHNPLALHKTLLHSISIHGLYSDDLDSRLRDPLDICRDTRDEPSSSDRSEDSVELITVGHLTADLHSNSSLTSNDIWVIVWWNECQAVSRC